MNKQEFRKLIREEIRNIINESKSTNTKNQPKNSSKKSLKEGYAWERSERKFGDPLPTLASIQAAHQAKHNIKEAPMTSVMRSRPLRIGKEYQLLDPGTNEYSDGWEYLGELAMGSSAGNSGDHMFKADDAPGAFVFVTVSNEDLKKEFVRTVGYDSKNIR